MNTKTGLLLGLFLALPLVRAHAGGECSDYDYMNGACDFDNMTTRNDGTRSSNGANLGGGGGGGGSAPATFSTTVYASPTNSWNPSSNEGSSTFYGAPLGAAVGNLTSAGRVAVSATGAVVSNWNQVNQVAGQVMNNASLELQANGGTLVNAIKGSISANNIQGAQGWLYGLAVQVQGVLQGMGFSGYNYPAPLQGPVLPNGSFYPVP